VEPWLSAWQFCATEAALDILALGQASNRPAVPYAGAALLSLAGYALDPARPCHSVPRLLGLQLHSFCRLPFDDTGPDIASFVAEAATRHITVFARFVPALVVGFVLDSVLPCDPGICVPILPAFSSILSSPLLTCIVGSIERGTFVVF